MAHLLRAALVGAALATLAACTPGTTPAAGTPTVGTLPACVEEDGSTPGQTFPCRWDAATMGNRQGESFTLAAPTVPGTCVWDPAAHAWEVVPCHYVGPGTHGTHLDLIILRQPTSDI